VAAVVACNLWLLRSLLSPAQTPNDFGMHVSMIRWATERIGAGHLPFDGWYPYLNLGSAQFSQYPTLAHVVGAMLAQVFDAGGVARWSAYLLLATWPIAVYRGARLAGFDRRPALAAAALSPLLFSKTNYGLELRSYTFRGFGIWPQIWAQWTLPLAWGLSWRAIARRERILPAAALVGLTFALHFVTGYVCIIGVGALSLPTVLDVARHHGRRAFVVAARAALVVAGGLAAISYVVVPLVQQSRWASFPGLDRQTVGGTLYSPVTALRWLVTGELYDHGRLPVVTILVAIGLVVCLARRSPAQQAAVAVWGVMVVVFTVGDRIGPLRSLLPGSSDLFTRFVLGVHLAGLLLAAVALAYLVERAAAWVLEHLVSHDQRATAQGARVAVGLAVAAAVVVTAPAWWSAVRYERTERSLVSTQVRLDRTEGRALEALVAKAEQRGPGRVFAGSATSWGRDQRLGLVPIYIWLNNHDVDAVGYWERVGSLSAETEQSFFESLPGHYPLYGVRYLLLPLDRQPEPGVPAQVIGSTSSYRLWEVDGVRGYLGVADTVGTLTADHHDLARKTLPFVAAASSAVVAYPTVAFDGAPAATPTATAASPDPPGSVVSEADAPEHGTFTGQVQLARTGAVILRSSYTGKWRTTIDGRAADPYMVAPSYVAVTVPPGNHFVRFTYRTYRPYWLLFLAGALALVALAALDRRISRPLTRPGCR
jgi:hypothetical protein